MRIILILQGAPGCGKSTFVERMGLAPWTVASDAVRLLFRAPEMHREGHQAISPSADAVVWRTLMAAVEERMRAGDLTVVDATHTRRSEVAPYCELAARYRYQVRVVSLAGVSVEDCVARNVARPELRRVPEAAVREMHARLAAFLPPEGATVIAPEDVPGVLADPVVDESPYARLVVTGGGPVAVREDELCVYVGGLRNACGDDVGALRAMAAAAMRPNVVVCEGARDWELRAWAAGEHDLPLPGLRPEEIRPLLARLVDGRVIPWRGRRVLVAHGGLTAMPEPGRLAFVASRQLVLGVGGPEVDVDAVFAARAPAGAVQIHYGRGGREGVEGRSVGLGARTCAFDGSGRLDLGWRRGA